MPVCPPQAVADLAAQIEGAGGGPGLPYPNAGVECGVYEVADRVDGNGYLCSQQPDESAADRRSECLSSGVCLIEPRIGGNQSRPGHKARKQRLIGGEPEDGKRTEQQQGDDE